MVRVSATSYVFAVPQNGRFAGWLLGFLIVVVIATIAAHVISRRGNYVVVRRRARELRSICLGLVVPAVAYAVARAERWDVLSWRLWMYALLAVFVARLVPWLLRVRRLSSDQVEERQRRRKESYFRTSKRRPNRRRR